MRPVLVLSLHFLFLTLFLNTPTALQAKRAAPSPVPDVTLDNVRFRVTNQPDTMGIVMAYDATTGAKLWQEKLYTALINPILEKDAQWVFITKMWIHKTEASNAAAPTLRLTNERGETFELDPKTRHSKKFKP